MTITDRIVKTYSDDAKSGLIIGGRMALQQMIADVESGEAEFSVILVYDVTRWGRFQDTDESAYYEYRCRKAGMRVAYCAEQFENDGSPTSTIVKSVKRAMAGEYSRELSVKVFAGQCRLIELGYRQGGPAGYGLRRALLNERGEVKAELKRGEHKSLQTDRVVLVPGPDDEVRTVRWIYSQFLKKGLSETEIATELNARGILTDLGRAWTRATVHQILTNEKYIGNNVYNRRSFKLKRKRVANGPEMWIRSDGAFEAIVEAKQFQKVQAIIAARNRRFSDEEMLDRLNRLLQRHGYISGLVIDEADGMPSSGAYAHRFGSLPDTRHCAWDGDHQVMRHDIGVLEDDLDRLTRRDRDLCAVVTHLVRDRADHDDVNVEVLEHGGRLGGLRLRQQRCKLAA